MNNSIEIIGDLVERTYAGPFLCLRGGLDFGQSRVPYLAASISASEAAGQIHLPGDLPVSAQQPIRIRELFQRDLNDDHVQGIVDYLKSDRRPRFFNSITVALLPLTPDGAGVAETYDQVAVVDGAPDVVGYEPIDVGPVRVLERSGSASHGYVSWSLRNTFPVVLDGQHRLRALRQALGGDPFPGRAELATARISVLFVVLDPRVGYRSQESLSVLDACREIFTDLNMHAMPVARARNLLLADRNLQALCLRRLLEEEVLGESSVSMEERTSATWRLPLALIDWRADGARFDTPTPYITTTLAMQAVVDGLLDTRLPDSTDYESLWNPLERVARRLLPPVEADALLSVWAERLEAAQENQTPFELSRHELRRLADGFHARYGRTVVAALMHFKPYRLLRAATKDASALGPTYEAWTSLDRRGRERLLLQTGKDDPGPRVRAAAEIVKKGNLAFQVVFQRALVQAIEGLTQQREEVIALLDNHSADSGQDAFVSACLHLYNDRLAPILEQGADVEGALLGAGVTPLGRIDYRKTRVSVITGFYIYLALAPGTWWKSPPTRGQVRDWLVQAWGSIGPGPKQGLPALYSRHGSQWKRGLGEVAFARQLETSEEVLLDLATDRVVAAIRASD